MTRLNFHRPSPADRNWLHRHAAPKPRTAVQKAALQLMICRDDLAAATAWLRTLRRGTPAHGHQYKLVAVKHERVEKAKIAYQTARLLEIRAAR